MTPKFKIGDGVHRVDSPKTAMLVIAGVATNAKGEHMYSCKRNAWGRSFYTEDQLFKA